MPTYSYQCECGLQFEAVNKVAKHLEPVPCPACKGQAPRMMPQTVSSFFKKEVTGPVPQNTGIHDLDTHIDRVIGQHAQQGWGMVEKRVMDKKKLLASSGAAPEDLSRTRDNTYRVLTPEEKEARSKALAVNKLVMQAKDQQGADRRGA